MLKKPTLKRQHALTNNDIAYDYLVVGAGATGMCFVDVILRCTNKTVCLVDKKIGPGGHWHEPYPYVKLHQPPQTYGIESIPLTQDDGISVKKHFETALAHFATNKNFTALFNIRVDINNPSISHKTLVDARYLEVTRIPSSWNMLTPWTLPEPVKKTYIVVGGGKTGMDTCLYLKQYAEKVIWVISHDAYWIKRESIETGYGQYPRYTKCAKVMEWIVSTLPGWFSMSLDNRIVSMVGRPERYRCGIVNESEWDAIQGVEIVRKGYVTNRVGDTLTFEDGSTLCIPNAVFVDCIQQGLPRQKTQQIFQKHKIVLQPVVMCQPCFSATIIAKMVATNTRLDLQPVWHPKTCEDGVIGYAKSMTNLAKIHESKLKDIVLESRLNPYD